MLYCVVQYDLMGKHRNRNKWYNFIWFYLTTISGLSYRMGGDGMEYFWQYPMYTISDGFGWDALTAYINRLPGWVLLNKLCKQVSNEYWFFKLIHAIIVNYLYYNFIKKYAPHIFSATLVFFVLLYFNLNFQILRQTLAMGFFLYSIQYYESKKWLKYFCVNLLAISFHESALISFVFPFMKLIKINKLTALIILSTAIFLFFMGPVLFSYIIFIVPEIYVNKVVYYSSNDDSVSLVSFLLNIILSVVIPLIVIYRSNDKYSIINMGTLFYGLSFSVGCNVDIFYRFSYFFQIFFYLFYINLLFDISLFGFQKQQAKSITKIKVPIKNRSYKQTFLILILLFLAYRGRMYFTSYGDTNMPSWIQYYPYSSIIFQDTDPLREEFIKKL